MELLQNQTKVKYNLNGAAGLTVNITLHPSGNRSITVLSVKVEICPIPAETGNLRKLAHAFQLLKKNKI